MISTTSPKEEVIMDSDIPTLTQETLVRVSLPKEDPTILLRVQSQKHPPISYITSPAIPLRNVLRDYCRRTHLDFETIRFLFDGKRVWEGDTPEHYGMEDDDAIDAFNDQIGGSGGRPCF